MHLTLQRLKIHNLVRLVMFYFTFNIKNLFSIYIYVCRKMKNKKCIKPVEPVVEPVEPEPAIKPVRLKNRFLKHWFKHKLCI